MLCVQSQSLLLHGDWQLEPHWAVLQPVTHYSQSPASANHPLPCDHQCSVLDCVSMLQCRALDRWATQRPKQTGNNVPPSPVVLVSSNNLQSTVNIPSSSCRVTPVMLYAFRNCPCAFCRPYCPFCVTKREMLHHCISGTIRDHLRDRPASAVPLSERETRRLPVFTLISPPPQGVYPQKTFGGLIKESFLPRRVFLRWRTYLAYRSVCAL